jgi:hypothetical protein
MLRKMENEFGKGPYSELKKIRRFLAEFILQLIVTFLAKEI